MKFGLSVLFILQNINLYDAFVIPLASFSKTTKNHNQVLITSTTPAFIQSTLSSPLITTSFPLKSTPDNNDSETNIDEIISSKEEKEEAVGNLIADDEWMGLTMEITEMVRIAILEDVKGKTADFIGKDDYNVGDISKELDNRVKTEVAKLRGKEEYELGDLVMALDTMSKDLTCELTGKEDYEFGDLSTEIDSRVKSTISDFCGKDEYEFGDLSMEIDKRSKIAVAEFTGNDEYKFGDITKEVENRRKKWMEVTLGTEAAERYEFGDLTKKSLANFTGKDEYQFGDVSKKIMGDLFGKRKRGKKE